ncbi:MAG: choloylglycine hydrolase [Pseudobutyrivibrio sp.]|nr:choloylglycine hydrolase [Pseudobutyrivibrio sp.]
MCTAATYYSRDHYFGRNLDLEFSYNETVTIMPRGYKFPIRHADDLDSHYALIGMAFVVDDYPLYYDAINEKGVGMAGLNFPTNAVYKELESEKDNITPFEFIPWILGQAASLDEARALVEKINLLNENFSEQLPLSPLHWMISDKTGSIVVEQTEEGLRIYDNPVGVMTNNPTFDIQLFELNKYMSLSIEPAQNIFAPNIPLQQYSRGMGAIGLPGDLSSTSRFVKAAFTRMNSISGESELESVSQFFHILGSVDQQRGCVHLGGDKYEITIYTSCCNLDKGIYYYNTYENHQITAIDMHKTNLDGNKLTTYPLRHGENIFYES